MTTQQPQSSERTSGPLSELLIPPVIGGAAVFALSLLLESAQVGDAVFFSYVLVLPLVVGAAMGARGWRRTQAAGVFVLAYLGDLVHDWIVTGGDQVFHLALAVITGTLAALAASVALRIRRRASETAADARR
jgi:hypothetical protein